MIPGLLFNHRWWETAFHRPKLPRSGAKSTYSPQHFSLREKRGEERNRQVPNWERSTSRLYIVTLLISLLCRVHHEKCWAGGSTSWNQDSGRNINNLRYTDDTTLMAENKEALMRLLMKDESEYVYLKLNIQKTKIMVSSPITSWQMRGGNGNGDRFYFGGAPKSLQIVTTAMQLKDACSLEEKLWPT